MSSVVLDSHWKHSFSASTSSLSALEVYLYTTMRYINRHFTYLLTYLLTYMLWNSRWLWCSMYRDKNVRSTTTLSHLARTSYVVTMSPASAVNRKLASIIMISLSAWVHLTSQFMSVSPFSWFLLEKPKKKFLQKVSDEQLESGDISYKNLISETSFSKLSV